jgi:DNA invertase Pin-like site-specific DNA recombinase
MLNMLAAIAEMERDLLIERIQSGLSRAKSEGKILGRPPKTSKNQRTEILSKFKHGASISELARICGLSRASILRVTRSL